jgi:hypothetical protein
MIHISDILTQINSIIVDTTAMVVKKAIPVTGCGGL